MFISTINILQGQLKWLKSNILQNKYYFKTLKNNIKNNNGQFWQLSRMASNIDLRILLAFDWERVSSNGLMMSAGGRVSDPRPSRWRASCRWALCRSSRAGCCRFGTTHKSEGMTRGRIMIVFMSTSNTYWGGYHGRG